MKNKPMNPSREDKVDSSKQHLLLYSLVISAFLVFFICFFFPPKWATNDDVGMSMIAHGYGIATVGSANILFSNVLWGHLVQLIPEINGVLGYSVATLGVLVTVGAIVIWGLVRRGVGYVACLSVLTLILTGPVVFPQFTINAGLLFIGAILCWQMYVQENSQPALLAGCILAFLSYLVRGPEFLLMFIVALPLLPWRALLLQRSAKYAICALILSIGISAIVDIQAYRGDDWKSFNELNPARAAFTDYGAEKILKTRPEILERNGFSSNDIDLISQWFFVDGNIANPKKLQTMLSELGTLSAQANSLTNAFDGIQAMWHPRLLAILVAALFLAFLLPNWKVVTSWGLCISAFFTLGLLGRPGVLHVYVPLICLLLVAPFLIGKISGWRKNLSTSILLVAALANASYVFAESKRFSFDSRQVRTDMATFPSIPVVIWGATFPYDAVYAVLGASSSAMSYQHIGLGTSTLAPFTVAYTEQKAGRGFANLFTQNGGIPIMAYPAYIKMLDTYCKERLHGKLSELSRHKYGATKKYGELEVSFLRYEVKQ